MSELPEGIPRAAAPVPRESASGIVLRARPDGGRDVLLALRARGTRFMPGHLAFPGGGLEAADGPGEPGAYARCVAREVDEETGFRIEPGRWLAAGERVTPPMFPVRFRTRFFVGELSADAAPPPVPPSPREIEELRFADPAEIIRSWTEGRCRIPPPVLPMLRALAELEGEPLSTLARRLHVVNELEQRSPRIEFTPGIWMLPVATPTMPPATHTNVWLPGGRRFVVIDPGSPDPDEQRRLSEVIGRRRALGAQPAAILLTHHHVDHVAGLPALARELGVAVRAHPLTLEALPGGGDGYGTETLEDGEEVDLGGMVLRAHHTPGHASGHLVFQLLGRPELIVGDLVSGLSTILIDPDTGHMGAYLDSLRRTKGLDGRMLLPGHGPPLPAKALAQLLEHRALRETRIRGELRPGGTALREVAAAAYDDVPQMPPALTERQTLAHLLQLEREGRARRIDADGGSWEPGGAA